MKSTRKNSIYGYSMMLIALLMTSLAGSVAAQDPPSEDDYFKLTPVLSPQSAILEVGGLSVMPNGGSWRCYAAR